MKKIIKPIVLILLSIYLVLGAVLFIKQSSFLYFPTKPTNSLHNKEVFKNGNESVYTTVLNPGHDKAIIYFGGNAEDVDYNANDFSKIFKSYTVYLVKYRGYGKSTGQPSEQNLYSDALYVYDKLKEKYSDISVIGRSLGSGVATYLAANRSISKLALITPFDSIESIAQEIFPIYPMSFILRDKYKSINRVSQIKAHTLILIAENDQVVKRSHSERLVSKFPAAQVAVKIIENTGHNSIANNRTFYEALRGYFER